jgi:hypothetical protein
MPSDARSSTRSSTGRCTVPLPASDSRLSRTCSTWFRGSCRPSPTAAAHRRYRPPSAPGSHVIYSAWAGYYLGLAKYNPENRGPIVVKGLLAASLIHGTYNVLVTYLPRGVFGGLGFVAFVVVFDGVFFYLLYRKLARYRDAYEETVDDAEEPDGDTEAELPDEDGKPEDGAGTTEADERAEPAEESDRSTDETG